eukprot:14064-Heterococcus_DN1.PRE.2
MIAYTLLRTVQACPASSMQISRSQCRKYIQVQQERLRQVSTVLAKRKHRAQLHDMKVCRTCCISYANARGIRCAKCTCISSMYLIVKQASSHLRTYIGVRAMACTS